jgi:Smg protein
MDLVVLVAELSQTNDKSLKDLDEELSHRGYSAEEIEQALFWVSSNVNPMGSLETGLYHQAASRVLSPWEFSSLHGDAYGYLLRLLNLGVIDINMFEKIMDRVSPYGGEKIPLADVKTLAASVIFNVSSDGFDEELFNAFDEDMRAS